LTGLTGWKIQVSIECTLKIKPVAVSDGPFHLLPPSHLYNLYMKKKEKKSGMIKIKKKIKIRKGQGQKR
jgi:hypothetical protein